MFEKLPVGTQVNREILFNGKNYKYSVRNIGADEDSDGEDWYRVVCRGARWKQDFLREDVNGAIESITDILAIRVKESEAKQSERVEFRLSREEKIAFENNSQKYGFASVSAFLRAVGTNPEKFLKD